MTTTINASTVSGLVNSADTSGILQLQTASTAALTITAGQLVGIGTATPTDDGGYGKIVDIYGSTGGAVYLHTSTATNYAFLGKYNSSTQLADSGSAGLTFATASGSTPVERMRIDSSGNVGIGMTASTNPKLQIKQFNNTTDGGLLITSADASGSAGLARLNDGGMTFRNAGAETMRIVSSGELVVGGTTAGGVGTSIAAPDSGGIYCNTSTTGARNQIRFVNPNGTVGSIQTSGSATSYNTSSDYRLKENITPMTGALAKVAQLKPVTYKWKIDGIDGEGFIAHELAEVCSHAVSGEKDAVDADGNPIYQGVDASFLVATLTAAIQELKAINDTQAETINALTARIVALESK